MGKIEQKRRLCISSVLHSLLLLDWDQTHLEARSKPQTPHKRMLFVEHRITHFEGRGVAALGGAVAFTDKCRQTVGLLCFSVHFAVLLTLTDQKT